MYEEKKDLLNLLYSHHINLSCRYSNNETKAVPVGQTRFIIVVLFLFNLFIIIILFLAPILLFNTVMRGDIGPWG